LRASRACTPSRTWPGMGSGGRGGFARTSVGASDGNQVDRADSSRSRAHRQTSTAAHHQRHWVCSADSTSTRVAASCADNVPVAAALAVHGAVPGRGCARAAATSGKWANRSSRCPPSTPHLSPANRVLAPSIPGSPGAGSAHRRGTRSARPEVTSPASNGDMPGPKPRCGFGGVAPAETPGAHPAIMAHAGTGSDRVYPPPTPLTLDSEILPAVTEHRPGCDRMRCSSTADPGPFVGWTPTSGPADCRAS